jgi:uncharacterized membrane protein HdeD (DUF308 family)
MTQPQPNRPEPGRVGGVTEERSPTGQAAVPPQATGREPGVSGEQSGPGAGDAAGAGAGAADAAYADRGGVGPGSAGAGGATAAGAAGSGLAGTGLGAGIARMAWTAALVAAIGMVAVGVMLLVWPNATLTVVAILIGAALIVAGLLRLFDGATARGESGGMRAADIVIGLLAVIAGLYCLKHHSLTVLVVALVVGLFWVIHGIGDLIVASTSGKVPGRGLKAIGGVISLAAGLVILFWPGISLILLLTVLGAWLIFYGVVLAGLAFELRRSTHRTSRPPQMAPA